MSFMIEMVRDSAEFGGRDRFSSSAEAWELLQEVGKTLGWKPLGTVYAHQPSDKLSNTSALHDYRPGDRQDRKIVVAEDALAWAIALSAARGSPHLITLIGARPGVVVLQDASKAEVQSVNAPFVVSLSEFAEYAYGGAFSFARA